MCAYLDVYTYQYNYKSMLKILVGTILKLHQRTFWREKWWHIGLPSVLESIVPSSSHDWGVFISPVPPEFHTVVTVI